MTGHKNPLKSVWYVTVCILIVSLITACSAGAGSAPQSPVNPEVDLNSSSRLSAEIAKPAGAGDEQPAKKAAQALPAGQPVAQAAENTPFSPEPVTPEGAAPLTGNGTESLAAPSQDLQPLPPVPPVDPNLPVGPKVGLRAPEFTLQAMDGKTYRLSELAGRPVLINYWATWCIPCKAELPILEKLYQEYQQKGMVVISVNAIEQDSTDKVQGIINQFGMTFPVLLDQGAQFANLYQAIFFPTTVLVDASGVIREINLGDSTEAELRTSLDNVVAGGF
jgi:cytochrome c biogenesis protein CcmG/thiol:disulfide interchange protein DsbE